MYSLMKRILFPGLFIFTLLLSLQSCRQINEDLIINQGNSRGELISYELVQTWDSTQLADLINSVDPFLNIFFRKEFDIAGYKVTYRTPSFDGTPTIATGAVMVPISRDGSSSPATMIGYSHGTTIHKDGVPSRYNGGGEETIGVLLAGDGFCVAMPDYLGLGDGPGFHPYTHAETEASAVIDILRATQHLASAIDAPLSGKVGLTGYSQGGHATMAAHRELELNLPTEFDLIGSAPMAGPYDASGVQEQYMLGFDPYPTPGYLPFILYSYDMVYDVLPNDVATSVLKPPYDSLAPHILGQEVSMGAINNMCNTVPRLMIREEYLNAYINDPNHPLKIALRDNDLYLGWVPQKPLAMFYCEGDDQVSYENAIVAYDEFMAGGAPHVELRRIDTDGDPLTHNDCAPGALLTGKLYLDSLNNL